MIRLLSIGIGRGHPFYLEGVAHSLRELGAGERLSHCTVFDLARYPERLGWQAMKGVFLQGGGARGRATLYETLRSFTTGMVGASISRALSRDLRHWAQSGEVCVVDHPVLAQALAGTENLIYQHGELGVPKPLRVPEDCHVLVPTQDAAERFVAGGVKRPWVHVTGLGIESTLVAHAHEWMSERERRYASQAPLCLAVFSSGAEPTSHLDQIIAAVRSVARAGHRATVFARSGGALERRLRAEPGQEMVVYKSHSELDQLTAEAFPKFDAVLSPAHERSSWGLGLGLPFLILGPDVGPFAPQNRARVLAAGCAREILSPASAANLGEDLSSWRESGELLELSRHGRAQDIDGFLHAGQRVLELSESLPNTRH